MNITSQQVSRAALAAMQLPGLTDQVPEHGYQFFVTGLPDGVQGRKIRASVVFLDTELNQLSEVIQESPCPEHMALIFVFPCKSTQVLVGTQVILADAATALGAPEAPSEPAPAEEKQEITDGHVN